MKSGSKNLKRSGKCIQGRGKDRLSELPDEVIVHILSFLPTLDAVRTVLLRRFGNLWTLVPTLEFRDAQFMADSVEEMCCDTTLNSRFSLFVRNVLSLHKRPTIDNFHLYIEKYLKWSECSMDSEAITEVQMWITFALSKDVKALTLVFGPSDYYFTLPDSLYTSQSLVMLKLIHCGIHVPSQAHMGSLKTLEMANVELNPRFSDFVIACPSLKDVVIEQAELIELLRSPSIETLTFKDVMPELPVTIDCPNLKILDIHMMLGNVDINIPSVREVALYCGSYTDRDFASMFKRLLEKFQTAEFLKFKWQVDKGLAYLSMMKVGFPENRWKHVVLYSSMQDAGIVGICSLVRNSPCLEELIIHTISSTSSSMVDEDIARMLASEETSSPCVVPCLKVVSIHGYGMPYEGQLQFAEFLLKSAVNLDKLIIISNGANNLTSIEEVRFLERLAKFPRASTHAVIVFE